MITDPIADYLTRIRNASSREHSSTTIPYTKIKEGISKVLTDRKFIEKFNVKKEGNFKEIEVNLKPWVKEPLRLKRLSKPGQRIYLKSKDIKAVRNGLGVLIISTSQGIMSGEQARKEKLGGEAICEVY